LAVNRLRRSPLTLVGVFADLAVCVIALILAEISTRATHGAAPYTLGQVLLFSADFAIAVSLMNAFVGLYRPKRLNVRTLLGRHVFALSVASYLTYLTIQVIAERNYAGELVATALIYLVVGLFLMYGLRWTVTRLRRPARVLIVGTGPDAESVADDLRRSPARRTDVIGFYDTQPASDAFDPSPFGFEPSYAGLGPLSGSSPGAARRVFDRSVPLTELVRREHVDEIIVAEKEQRGGGLPMDQLLTCRVRGTPVLDLAGYFERTSSEVRLEGLKASWLIYGEGFVQGRLRRAAKRGFDILVSALLLGLALPVMLLAAIVIKLDSRGPVFYRQLRVGLGGGSFTCIKFRSMRVDAERDGVARWASKGDSRITRVGSFLRATRIDELPQLWSVLNGEMSMVGPRPERPEFVAVLREQIPFYDVRHSVKPGLTGWAQVRFAYGASVEDARRKHQFDLYYVKNNSLLLDALVLIETVSVVLFREGQ
jgi:sugar transferase (PEP-CTERM system associated)